MKTIGLAAAVVLFFSVSARTEAQDANSDVAKSWQKGVAYVPGKSSSMSPVDIGAEKPYPVVLYLHGCSGIGPTDKRWGPFLRDQGFIVIQPDSLERDRPKSCDPAARRSGMFPGVFKARLEEMNYAREQIAKSPWADQKNVFIMGHSEGGVAVALTSRADFRGAIISAWHCGTTGLRTAPDVPVLAIDHNSDPFYPGVAGGGCGKHFGGRPRSRMITLAGHDHDTFENSAREGLAAFLKEQLAQP